MPARLPCAATTVDLGSLAREVAREFGPAADRRGSRLQVRTAEQRALALADPDRTRQIIRILLDNALTHTPEGTKVTVTTYNEKDRAALTVSDEGPGIPSGSSDGFRALLHRRLGQRLRPRPGDRARARAANGGRGSRHLEQALYRVHARPAAVTGAERAAEGAPREAGGVRTPPGARRARPGPAHRLRRGVRQLGRRLDQVTAGGDPDDDQAGRRADRRTRLRRGQGLPGGLPRGGHDPLHLRRQPAPPRARASSSTRTAKSSPTPTLSPTAAATAAGRASLRRVPGPQRRPGRRSSASTPSPTSPC